MEQEHTGQIAATASLSAGCSRPVHSNQNGVHDRIREVVARHLSQPWLKPVSAHSRTAFKQAYPVLQAYAGRLILDAGCGTGDSSRRLAMEHPHHLVMGVDQSSHRLSRARTQPEPENLLLIRADLQDFWRLLHASDLRLFKHFLLYPNPWPRKQHLQRRWHGHPVFPWILALGGVLELRSNWVIYVEEFAQALLQAGLQCERFQVEKAGSSPFELKYHRSGQPLFALQADLREAAIDVPGPPAFAVEDHTTG